MLPLFFSFQAYNHYNPLKYNNLGFFLLFWDSYKMFKIIVENYILKHTVNLLIINYFLGTSSRYDNRTSQFARTRLKLNIFGNPGNPELLVSLYTCKSLRFQKYRFLDVQKLTKLAANFT